MVPNLFNYSLSVWFFFYVINHSGYISSYVNNLMNRFLWEKVKYAFNCAFCFAFWVSLPVVFFAGLPFWYIFAAPSMVLLWNLVFLSLTQ